MIRISMGIIVLFVSFKRMYITYADGSPNAWLEPQIFEFGKPGTLNCNITEKTKAVAWWIVKENRSPKKISNEPVLNFTSANHSHSAIYECFHTFENNGFQKYSRKVLVLETRCSKCIPENLSHAQSLINWKFRFSIFSIDDVFFECNGTRISYYNCNGITFREANFVSSDSKTCSVGLENSKLYPTKCQTTVNDHKCDQSCFLSLESRKNHQDVSTFLQLEPSGKADQMTTAKINSNPPAINVISLVISLIVNLIIIIIILMVLAARYRVRKHSKEIFDFREDEDADEPGDGQQALNEDAQRKELENQQASTDNCRATIKTATLGFLKKIFCFVNLKSCRGNLVRM